MEETLRSPRPVAMRNEKVYNVLRASAFALALIWPWTLVKWSVDAAALL